MHPKRRKHHDPATADPAGVPRTDRPARPARGGAGPPPGPAVPAESAVPAPPAVPALPAADRAGSVTVRPAAGHPGPTAVPDRPDGSPAGVPAGRRPSPVPARAGPSPVPAGRGAAAARLPAAPAPHQHRPRARPHRRSAAAHRRRRLRQPPAAPAELPVQPRRRHPGLTAARQARDPADTGLARQRRTRVPPAHRKRPRAPSAPSALPHAAGKSQTRTGLARGDRPGRGRRPHLRTVGRGQRKPQRGRRRRSYRRCDPVRDEQPAQRGTGRRHGARAGPPRRRPRLVRAARLLVRAARPDRLAAAARRHRLPVPGVAGLLLYRSGLLRRVRRGPRPGHDHLAVRSAAAGPGHAVRPRRRRPPLGAARRPARRGAGLRADAGGRAGQAEPAGAVADAALTAASQGAPIPETAASRLLSSHPDYHTRLHHLQQYLQPTR